GLAAVAHSTGVAYLAALLTAPLRGNAAVGGAGDELAGASCVDRGRRHPGRLLSRPKAFTSLSESRELRSGGLRWIALWTWGLLKRLYRRYNESRLQMLAAALAYYAAFSLGPLLLLLAGWLAVFLRNRPEIASEYR